jgi:GTP-sensing pleiotropic transcriptional regulator CodY
MSPQIFHHVQKQGRRGRPRKYAQDGTRLKNSNNSKDPSATQLPIEQKPREERSYKDFYPDLNIKEPLTIVKLAKNSNEATEDEKAVTTSTETTPMSTESQEEQKQEEEEEEEEDKMVKLPVPLYSRVDREEDDEILFERPTNHYIRYRGRINSMGFMSHLASNLYH